ncbi:MAG: type II toxin-antitoxin system RelE/ParE family toxin [Oscillospiraceae bacterium]|nr:type II toxin-antitoxin system RelE/ParE family toxin [Oscillospiraceae bacterium]
MYNVIFMDLAYEDYNEISEYLSQFYPSTAEKFLNELEKYVSMLKRTPHAFEVYQPCPKYRRVVVRDYLVFYKVFDEVNRVEIHRILHGTRNVRNILKV